MHKFFTNIETQIENCCFSIDMKTLPYNSEPSLTSTNPTDEEVMSMMATNNTKGTLAHPKQLIDNHA